MEEEQLAKLFQEIGYLKAKAEDTNIMIKEIKEAQSTFTFKEDCKEQRDSCIKKFDILEKNSADSLDYIKNQKTLIKHAGYVTGGISACVVFIMDIAFKVFF